MTDLDSTLAAIDAAPKDHSGTVRRTQRKRGQQMSEKPGTYAEWRITAEHKDPRWREKNPPYEFVWSERFNRHQCVPDAETAARAFMDKPGFRNSCENVQLTHRVVVIGPWSRP